jgi:molybdenum cofactor guanylyltransferase
MTKITALILAGGNSSRMGQDKAQILWDGIPMLRRVYDAASACSSSVCVLTPWPDRYRDTLPPDCCWLEELKPGEGPLVALAQGCKQIESEWIWLLGCDLPQLRVEVLREWTSRLDPLPPDILALVPQQSSGWEPLCGFYRRSVESALDRFLDSGGRSFQQWLPQIAVRSISVGEAEAQMLHNCNSPEDLLIVDS